MDSSSRITVFQMPRIGYWIWRAFTHVLFFSYIGSKLRHTSKLYGNFSFEIWKWYTRYYMDLSNRLFRSSYTTADPFAVFYVDPDHVKYPTERPPTKPGIVDSGDWDSEYRPFTEANTVAKSIQMRFDNNVEWDYTPLKDVYQEEYGDDFRVKFEEDCDRSAKLYDSMRSAGYRSQKQLLKDDYQNTLDLMDNEDVHPLMNEVGISIGRNGELLWTARGQHRLAIAKLLSVDKIPVRIIARHGGWEKKRREENCRPTGSPHPDLEFAYKY